MTPDLMRDILTIDVSGYGDGDGDLDDFRVQVWFPGGLEPMCDASLDDAYDSLTEVAIAAERFAKERAAQDDEVFAPYWIEGLDLQMVFLPAGFDNELVGVVAFVPDPQVPTQTVVSYGIVSTRTLELWSVALDAQLETADDLEEIRKRTAP